MAEKYLNAKIDQLLEATLADQGYAETAECLVTAYIECLVLVRGGDPTEVWRRWPVDYEPEGFNGPRQPLSRTLAYHRPKLVAALRKLREDLWLPKASGFKAPVPAEPPPPDPEPERVEEEQAPGILELFGLGEDDHT